MKFFSRNRSVVARHANRVGSDEEWAEFKRQYVERAHAIAAETGATREAIVASEDSTEAAYAQLISLYEYSAGRTAAAREIIQKRVFDEPERTRSIDPRCAVVLAEARAARSRLLATAALDADPSDESYELFRAEFEAVSEKCRGRLYAIFEDTAKMHGRTWPP